MQKGGVFGGNEEFLHHLLTHRFVLCPPGNGVDTHRMWEVLAAGSIPIVLRSQAMMPFKDLRILFVDRYEDVTINLLQETWEMMKTNSVSHPMLAAEYWIQKINEAKESLKGREIMPMKEWITESFRYGVGMIGRRLFG
jgi:hypothetical protein